MTPKNPTHYIAFEGSHGIAAGTLKEVALAVKAVEDRGSKGPVLIFDQKTSQPVELDLRGSEQDVLDRIAPPPETEKADTEKVEGDKRNKADRKETNQPKRRGPGRPRLGVVAREVTLLPRHWAWLKTQPGGASGSLRKLVDKARRDSAGPDRTRTAQESAYRFLSAMAGNEAGFEEAIRALFAGDGQQFDLHVSSWPDDVRKHAQRLAAVAFDTADLQEKNR